jgi:hypothetical protein
VLWAKAIVLIAIATPVMFLACLSALLLNQAFLGSDGASIGDPGVARALVGAAVAPVAMGVFGLGIGAMLRHTAAGITTYVVTVLVLPALLPAALPQSVGDDVLPYLPTVASQAMYSLSSSENPFRTFSPGASALVLAVWVVVVLAGGASVLARRDA